LAARPFWRFDRGRFGLWPLVLLLGLLLDLIYGVPVGFWHFLYVPFTLLSALVAALQHYSARYFISDTPEYL